MEAEACQLMGVTLMHIHLNTHVDFGSRLYVGFLGTFGVEKWWLCSFILFIVNCQICNCYFIFSSIGINIII